MELHHYYINLLVKQLSTPLSEREQAELTQWLSTSEEHRTLAREYQETWNHLPRQQPQLIQPDVEAAFNKVMGRIATLEAPVPLVVKVNWSRRLMRVAAVLALVAVALWGYREMTTPAEMETATASATDKMEVKLADGSVVWLRQGASLRFPTAFDGGERCVELDGEAYFEVAHRSEQGFCIEVKGGEKIQVLGTSFNVKPGLEGTTVTVKTGRVKFEASPKGESVIVTAGNKAIHRKNAPDIAVETAATLNDMAWQRGGLEFIQTPVQQVIRDMEAFYRVKIDLEGSNVAQCRYNAPLGQLTVEKALENLCTLYNIRLIRLSPGHYVLKGGTCS